MRNYWSTLLVVLMVLSVFPGVVDTYYQTVVSRAVGLTDGIGVLYSNTFVDNLQGVRFPVYFDVNSSQLGYLGRFNFSEFYDSYFEFAGKLSGFESIGVVLVASGVSIYKYDLFDDLAVGILVDRALQYALSKYDAVVPLIGPEASVEKFMALLKYLEDNGKDYGLYGFAHGVLFNSTHGVILFDSMGNPVVVNGDTLSQYVGKPSHIGEFVWLSCFAKNELELYGSSSFVGFFDSANVFLVYGDGVVGVPQELVDYYDSIIQPYTKIYEYPVAIVENGSIIEGSLIVSINVTVQEVTLQSNISFALSKPILKPLKIKRTVKSVTVKTVKKSTSKPSEKTLGKKMPIKGKIVTTRGGGLITSEVDQTSKYATSKDNSQNGNNNERNNELITQIEKQIKQKVDDGVKTIKESIVTKQKVKKLLNEKFASVKNSFKGWLREAIAKIIPPKVNILGALVDNPMYVAAVSIADGIVDSTLGSVQAVINWAVDNLKFVAELIIKAIKFGWNTFKLVAGIIMSKLLEAVSSLLSFIGKGLNWLVDTLSSVIGLPTQMKDLIKKHVNGIITKFIEIANDTVAFAKKWVEEGAKHLSEALNVIIFSIMTTLKNSFTTILNAITNQVKGILDKLVDLQKILDIISTLNNLIESVVSTIKTVLTVASTIQTAIEASTGGIAAIATRAIIPVIGAVIANYAIPQAVEKITGIKMFSQKIEINELINIALSGIPGLIQFVVTKILSIAGVTLFTKLVEQYPAAKELLPALLASSLNIRAIVYLLGLTMIIEELFNAYKAIFGEDKAKEALAQTTKIKEGEGIDLKKLFEGITEEQPNQTSKLVAYLKLFVYLSISFFLAILPFIVGIKDKEGEVNIKITKDDKKDYYKLMSAIITGASIIGILTQAIYTDVVKQGIKLSEMTYKASRRMTNIAVIASIVLDIINEQDNSKYIDYIRENFDKLQAKFHPTEIKAAIELGKAIKRSKLQFFTSSIGILMTIPQIIGYIEYFVSSISNAKEHAKDIWEILSKLLGKIEDTNNNIEQVDMPVIAGIGILASGVLFASKLNKAISKIKDREITEEKIGKYIKEKYQKVKKILEYLTGKNQEEMDNEFVKNELGIAIGHVKDYRKKRIIVDFIYTLISLGSTAFVSDKNLRKVISLVKGTIGILSTHYDLLEDIEISKLDIVTVFLSAYRIGQTIGEIVNIQI